jgi:hypothetical protein
LRIPKPKRFLKTMTMKVSFHLAVQSNVDVVIKLAID